MRKEFPDAIFWTANLVTGDDGTATVQLAYPDALTTWRVTARAVTPDTLVGTTVARTTITKDLIVRVVTPRFLTEGDEVVGARRSCTTTCRAAKTVTVAMKADGVVAAAPDNAAPQPQRLDVAQGGEAAERLARSRRTGSGSGGLHRDGHDRRGRGRGRAARSRSCRSASSGRPARRARSRGEGDGSAELAVPAHRQPGGAGDPRVARAVAGRPDARRARLPHVYPYGCTEQTLSSFLPEPAGAAGARAVEDRARPSG